MKIDPNTTVVSDKTETGYDFALDIKVGNTYQRLDLMLILMIIDNRYWRITGDRSELLYDLATKKLTEAVEEEARAEERRRELARVVLEDQLPFLRRSEVRKVQNIGQYRGNHNG